MFARCELRQAHAFGANAKFVGWSHCRATNSRLRNLKMLLKHCLDNYEKRYSEMTLYLVLHNHLQELHNKLGLC